MEDPKLEVTSHRGKLGVSACLLGHEVRYDGGQKLDPPVVDALAPYVKYVPICPEVECGLPVPREPMHLVGDPASPRLVTCTSAIDHTDRIRTWAEKRLAELEQEQLCGFLFKCKSPSCAMTLNPGIGIWARMVMEGFPLLPCADEEQLHNPSMLEEFIQRITACK